MHRGEGRRGTKVHRGDGGCLNQATSNSAYERDPPPYMFKMYLFC